MSRMTVATTCMQVMHDKHKNLERMLAWVDQAADQGARLVVFPEQVLQGYLFHMRNLYTEQYDYQYANAETVPDGPCVQCLIQKAEERRIYVVFGMTEQDFREPDILYNTAVLAGPEGYVGRYRKVHLPMDELHIYTPGTGFPVFDTAIGRIGMMICYDKSFPEAARSMVLQGAQILVCPLAWGIRTPEQLDLETDEALRLYQMYDYIRPTENMCFYISSNQIYQAREAHYCGHSNIISPYGKLLATTGYQEGLCCAEIDVEADMIRARYMAHNGNCPIRERRPQAYSGKLCGLEE